MTTSTPDDLVIVIPVYNDWEAVAALLRRLDAALAELPVVGQVILLDDGSTDQPGIDPALLHALGVGVSILSLRRNLGHQRAIAVGLAWVERHVPCAAVVIMDGDGEDDPADVPRLVDRLRQNGYTRIVFAERTRRLERPLFRVFYQMYCWSHHLLTGIRVRVGNFSIVPARLLPRIATVPELWNHYAAAIFQARIPYEMMPTARAPRLAGHSRMNFVGLVTHGLSAISVHSQIVGVRLLMACGAGTAIAFVLMLAAVLFALATGRSTAPVAIVMLLVLLVFVQATAAAVAFVFTTLYGRASASFLPARDYSYFVGERVTLKLARDRVHDPRVFVSR